MKPTTYRAVWVISLLALALVGCGGGGPGNNPPVANAGPDQTSNVLVGDVVPLDGSASSDADGQALTYSWSLMVVPAGSAAALSDRAVADPNFVADKTGAYTARLTVNDGLIDSAPDEVSITVVIPPPVVSITNPENLSVVTTSPVTVTGTVDDPSATIKVNGAAVANNNGSYATAVGLQEGSNTVTVVGQNGTGEGSASAEVILNTVGAPAISITSPKSGFVAGEEFAVGAPFHAAQVSVTGVIKVNTSAFLPANNKPTVTVNGVPADVSLNLFFSECGLFNPFQCWKFTATIALERGNRIITAVGTDQAIPPRSSTTGDIGGIVDYCRIGVWDGNNPTPIGKDPGVLALAGINHDIQGNRCHEIDGCSVPVLGELGNEPMPGAVCNVASTKFGEGTVPPSEHFVHGLRSQFNLPCNKHDVCYQTCVPVAGLSESAKEEAWKEAMHTCNRQQYWDTLEVCRRAYPTPICPPTFSVGCVLLGGCLKYMDERNRCFNRAAFYFAGVELGGFTAFKDRQEHYCAG